MSRRALWFACLAVALLLCAISAHPPRDRRLGHLAPLLPRPELVRAATKPFLHLVTDYYWIQTVQAVGRAQTGAEYRDAHDYAQMVAALDPRFRQVYLFVGVVIPVKRADGTWQNVDESLRLLKLGVERFPQEVFLRLVLAYNLATMKGEYAAAARVLEEAALLPGAPAYLGPLATRMYAQAGKFDAAEAFAATLARDAEDPETREVFEARLRELQLEKELQWVDAAARAFRSRTGRAPRDVQELRAAGHLDRDPKDPLGGEIVLGPDGAARSTAQKQRLTDFAKPEVKP
jgi:hypothetical protein